MSKQAWRIVVLVAMFVRPVRFVALVNVRCRVLLDKPTVAVAVLICRASAPIVVFAAMLVLPVRCVQVGDVNCPVSRV